jgi:hypothetical protein
MSRFFAYIILSAALCVSLRGEYAGSSIQDAVRFEPMFFHELPPAISRWVKAHVSSPKTRSNGDVVGYSQDFERDGRTYRIETVALSKGAALKLYFDISNIYADRARTVPEVFFFPEYLDLVEHCDKMLVGVLKDPKGHSLIEADVQWLELPAGDSRFVVLRSLLLSKRSYVFDSASLCWPDFYLAVRLEKGAEELRLEFCFTCSQLGIFKDGKRLPFRDIKKGEFAKAFHDLFPRDPAFN